MEMMNATGRRKEAIARVYLTEGTGNMSINNKSLEEYFPLPQTQYMVKLPLQLTETEGKYDINVNLVGGGVKGQSEALSLALARALQKIEPEYRGVLKERGLLRRDPREVERKKSGQPKARKKTQFSKR